MSASGDHEPIARLAGVTIDVHDLAAEKAFWQRVLGLEVDGENDDWVDFSPRPGDSGLSLQRVPEAKEKKNRVHPDLMLSDYESGIRRLEELGATSIREITISDRRWRIMLDPDGNEFCAIGML